MTTYIRTITVTRDFVETGDSSPVNIAYIDKDLTNRKRHPSSAPIETINENWREANAVEMALLGKGLLKKTRGPSFSDIDDDD